ncbi:MAG: hypothetical protein AABX71_03020 [Nanoarchaeota archaeon]
MNKEKSNEKARRLMLSKKAMEKRTLAVLLVLIISTVIIFLFIRYIPWFSIIDKTTCHQSVVLRSTFNYGALELGKKLIPLKCKTEEICLSSGGECEKLEDSATKVKLSKDEEEAREKIKETIANAMYDCHSMLGEGKLGFMPRTTWTQNYCLICSRFALDEQAGKEIEGIGYGEMFRYLQEKETPQGESYLEYLYPEWKNWENSKKLFEALQKESDSEEFKKLKFEDWKINLDFDNGYAVIAQIAPEQTFFGKVLTAAPAVFGVAVTITGGVLTATGVGGPVGAALLFLGPKITTVGLVAAGPIFWYTHSTDEKFEYSPPSIFPFDKDALRELECYTFEDAP